VDATQSPWAQNFRMDSYVSQELPAVIAANFAVDTQRAGIFGHSMGGHGALVLALRNPEIYKSVSAFAPIVSPLNCPWGEKALAGYLGPDRAAWQDYDSCALITARGWKGPAILVDQGTKDPFLQSQLKPELLQQACEHAGVPLDLRMRDGYDHSYFFIASFMESHLRFHAEHLTGSHRD
jgi:S-formylglutathione hydrolase